MLPGTGNRGVPAGSRFPVFYRTFASIRPRRMPRRFRTEPSMTRSPIRTMIPPRMFGLIRICGTTGMPNVWVSWRAIAARSSSPTSRATVDT